MRLVKVASFASPRAVALRALIGRNKQAGLALQAWALGCHRTWLSLAEGVPPMTNPRKIVAAALAAAIAITLLSISTSASAWARCGGEPYEDMALGAAASYPCSDGYYGSAYPPGYGYYASGNYGYYGAAPVATEGYYCATPVKTCLLKEPGWLGTGCSCAVSCGRARGIVE
jgi:hypothetical protein